MATTTPTRTSAQRPPIARRRHYGRWTAAVILLLVAAVVAHSLVTNPRYEWGVAFTWFHSPRILLGLLRTLELTAVSMLIGVVLGGVVGVMRMSSNPVVAAVAWFYVWLFRGTPVFVQLLFWGSISALYPVITVGIPFGPAFAHFSANDVVTPFIAAILGLGLNEGAYMAEIVRAGLRSVDPGQREAAAALGMNPSRALVRIVMPQAMPVLIPPTANELIGLLKSSSMVSVLAFPELLYSAQLIYSDNYQTIPLLLTASIWYLVVTSVLSVGQYFLERHYGRSFSARVSRRAVLAPKGGSAV
ncbi:amino acid ABC transporter permease [Curtobacterium sp. MCBD17_028]|uniref:amino acid ABC transporter permease n=1 Tax=Curtobacterium sp. MCBD17_028 TaxID=2175670 RepID=UPI000DA711DF|nr:amino acid ABC transporter permease [Curtobacterium sp. MCBD17_028]PZE24147.1 amino acid ABC transporter permease [Curtobacterium sp. MCBD17_028]